MLWFIVKNKDRIKIELENYKHINNIENIFYSTCFAFIGFNIINSLTTQYFETATVISLPVNIPVLYIYSVTISPFIEECICRGIIFKKLSSRFSFGLSALVSSLVFAIPHFNLSAFIGYVFIGFIWCWYYKKSNSLLVPILSHALFNFTTILIMSLKG
ncbi:lysostaphin resistance A-like protein [Paenibacillus sp. USHLN196]|uniref:CPBP family intramembrane glutamic endopeptidase n=1 Tax=Paenibacillus sp. USHLN196 TaxID=3081291 RepID=UPI003FA78F49